MGFLILFALSAYALLSSLALACRHYQARSAETWIAACAIWMALILVPIHALGWLGLLTAIHLGLVSALISSATLAVAFAHLQEPPFGFMQRVLRDAVSVPLSAFASAWRARSVVVLGLVSLIGLALFTATCAYLAPSSAWDGVWYHESMVGFAIQNHGFSWVEVPGSLEYVNGYPHGSEMLNLWFVIFSGRRLIEVVPSIMALILFLGMYGLARRLVSSPVHAMGWACGLVLIPGVTLQLRSTYTDVSFAASFVLALYFMTRPDFRIVDFLIGGVATGLFSASKGSALFIAPTILALGVLRALLGAKRTGFRRVAFSVVFVLIAGSAFGLPTYLRNWQRTGNPVWPVRHEIAALDLTFKGPEHFVWTRPSALTDFFSPPKEDQQVDTKDNGYGNVLPFVVPPLLLAALLKLASDLMRRRTSSRHDQLLWLVLIVAPSFASPAGLWWARLQLHLVVVALLFCAWMLGRTVLTEGVLGAIVIGSVITQYWSLPSWDMDSKTLRRILEVPQHERDIEAIKRTLLPTEIARARERELTHGQVIAFDGAYGFPSSLWNNDFSNRLVFLSTGPDKGAFAPTLTQVKARWVVAGKQGAWDRALKAAPDRWQLIGPINPWNNAYRQKVGSDESRAASAKSQNTD